MRHKLFTVFLIVSVLLMSLSFLTFQNNKVEANPSSIVDANITKNNAIRLPHQHKIFQAVTRYWYWYCTGTAFGFKSSLDGISWSSFTSIGADNTAAYFDVYFSGTKIYYARDESVGTHLYFRSGTPNSDGTITWDSTEQLVLTNSQSPGDPSVIVDSNGYPWIAYVFATQPNVPYIVKSDYNNGSWLTSSGYPYALTTKTYYFPVVFPLLSGKLYAIYVMGYKTGTPDYVYGRLYNGTGWETETKISTSKVATDDFQEWDALSDIYGNGHVVFINATTHNIIYIQRNNVTGVWGSEEQVYANAGDSTAVSISYYSSVGVYCFWNGYPTSGHYYYCKRTSGVWGSAVDWVYDADGIPNKRNLSTSGKTYNNKILVGWLAKTSSPYAAKFETLLVGDTTPPTYSNINVNTTLAGQPCKFSILWNDNVNITQWKFSSNNTGTWIDYTTVTSNTFTFSGLSNDGYAYCYGTVYYPDVWTGSGDDVMGSGIDTSSSYVRLGQQNLGGTFFIYRSFPYFNTSSLSDSLSITSATLSLNIYADYSLTDFYVTIQNGQPNYPHNTLQYSDYTPTLYSGNGGNKSTSTISGSGYWNIPLTSIGLGWINKTDITKLCIRSSRDIAQTSPTQNETIYYYSYEGGSTKWPQLTVTQSLGAETWANYTMTLNGQAGKTIGYRWYCQDTSGNWNDTGIQTLTTTDPYAPTYSYLGTNTTIAGNPCLFRCKWTDDTGLSMWRFGSNNTGTWVNDTWTAFTANPDWSEITKTLNSTVGVKITYRFWANDTGNNWADTGLTFLTTSAGNVTIEVYYSWVSDGRLDISSQVTIKFRFRYNTNQTPCETGSAWVNGTECNIDAVGLVTYTKTYATVGKRTFTITQVDVKGYTDFQMVISDVQVIWDRVTINFLFLESLDNRINVGDTATFAVGGKYDYDNGIWSGTYTLNDTASKNTVGKYWYKIQSVTDSLYGLTVFQQTASNVYVIFDKLTVTFSANNVNPDVDEVVTISWTITRQYDGSTVTDFVIDIARDSSLWKSDLTSSSTDDIQSVNIVRVYTLYPTTVTDNTYELTAAQANSVTVTWGTPALPPDFGPILPFLQFLWAGDFFGFILAVFTQAFLSPDIFIAVVAMFPIAIIYIRTKSLLLLSIMWILLGGFFLAAMPLISVFAVLFLVLGVGTMLFQLFMSARG